MLEHSGESVISVEDVRISLTPEDLVLLESGKEVLNDVVNDTVSRIQAGYQAAPSKGGDQFLRELSEAVERALRIQDHLGQIIHESSAPVSQPPSFAASVGKVKVMQGLNQRCVRGLIHEAFGVSLKEETTAPGSVLTPTLFRYGHNVQTDKEALEWLCKHRPIIRDKCFDEMNLEGVDLSGGVFINTVFRASNLRHAKFDQAILKNAEFNECNLQGATAATKLHTFKWKVATVAYSPNGQFVAFGGVCKKAKGTELAPGKIVLIKHGCGTIELDTESGVDSLTFTGASTLLISGERNGSLILWNSSSGKPHGQFQHSSGILAITSSPDLETVIAGARGNDENLKAWDLKSQAEVFSLPAHNGSVGGVDCSPCGKFFVTGGLDRRIVIWDFQSQSILREFKENSWPGTPTCLLCPVKFLPGSRLLLIGAHRGQGVKLWDLKSDSYPQVLQGNSHSVRSISVSGRFIAVGYYEKWCVDLFDRVSCKYLYCFQQPSGQSVSAAMSPCGRFVVGACNGDGTVRTVVNWAALEEHGLPDTDTLWEYEQYHAVECNTSQADEQPRTCFTNS